jgi:hypothetical protein
MSDPANPKDEQPTGDVAAAARPALSGAAIAQPGIGINTDPAAAAQATQPVAVGAGSPAGGASGSQELEPITFGPFDAEHPERIVGAAFAGAWLFARILRKVTE